MSDKFQLTTLPLDKLPAAWQDESRVSVLFAPFRNRNVNAKDWDSKHEFWKQSICVYCSHNKVYSIKLVPLQKAFQHNGRQPLCLQLVFEEMIKSQEIVPLSDFLAKATDSWSGWATNLLIKKPITWSFNKIKSSLIGSNIGDVTYIHLGAIRADCKEIVAAIPENYVNKVVDVEDVMGVIGFKDKESFKLLLHYLCCSGEAAMKEVVSSNGNKPILLVKFLKVKGGCVDDKDVDVYMLGQTEKILAGTVEKLENEMASLIKEAKGHLAKGHKQMAKTCLRKKHDVEKRIEARANALYNVQTLQGRIEDAGHDSQVVEAYKFALDSLRTNFKENKISEDSVTNTMIEIGEVLDIHNDIESTLAQPLSESDADLEAELDALLAAEDDQPSNHNHISPKPNNISDSDIKDISDSIKDIILPDVPTDEPVISSPVVL